jgi:DNA-binding CsgD family transcriptional regulator
MSDVLKQFRDTTPYRAPSKRSAATKEHEAAVSPGDEGAFDRASLPLAPLGALLDTIEQGIVLLHSGAFPCYSNSTAQRLLGADSERGVLARELRSVSRTAFDSGEHRPMDVEVATQAGWYRVRATLLLQRINEISSPAVMVIIERAEANLPSREFLMRRFAMTVREADVAHRLARGARNAAIASALHISSHTARHHTESVLAKLNVHTRGEVARAIVDGPAPKRKSPSNSPRTGRKTALQRNQATRKKREQLAGSSTAAMT